MEARLPVDERTSDQHNAFIVVTWLSEADRSGRPVRSLEPSVMAQQRSLAGVEGKLFFGLSAMLTVAPGCRSFDAGWSLST